MRLKGPEKRQTKAKAGKRVDFDRWWHELSLRLVPRGEPCLFSDARKMSLRAYNLGLRHGRSRR